MPSKDPNPLRIILDSDSFTSKSAEVFEKYYDNKWFDFAALGRKSRHTNIQISLDETQEKKQMVINKMDSNNQGHIEHWGFFYHLQTIRDMAQKHQIQYDDLLMAHIAATFAESESRPIVFITERKYLLDRVNWKQSYFPDLPANTIFDPTEGKIFLDLYLKQKDIYLLRSNYLLNRFRWYLYSLRTKVHFQTPWSICIFADARIPDKEDLTNALGALADRITDMLAAIDEIGTNYFKGANNNTLDTEVYHFNYWITLYTGVLDSLAWLALHRYHITVARPTQIGLRESKHGAFLADVFSHNASLQAIIRGNRAVIEMLYDARDLVIHRTRLEQLHFDNSDQNFYLNMVRISSEFYGHIVTLSGEKGSTLSTWGHFVSGKDYFLEPFAFVRQATARLIEFVNTFLDALAFEDYLTQFPDLKKKIDEQRKEQAVFFSDLDDFQRMRLGY